MIRARVTTSTAIPVDDTVTPTRTSWVNGKDSTLRTTYAGNYFGMIVFDSFLDCLFANSLPGDLATTLASAGVTVVSVAQVT